MTPEAFDFATVRITDSGPVTTRTALCGECGPGPEVCDFRNPCHIDLPEGWFVERVYAERVPFRGWLLFTPAGIPVMTAEKRSATYDTVGEAVAFVARAYFDTDGTDIVALWLEGFLQRLLAPLGLEPTVYELPEWGAIYAVPGAWDGNTPALLLGNDGTFARIELCMFGGGCELPADPDGQWFTRCAGHQPDNLYAESH